MIELFVLFYYVFSSLFTWGVFMAYYGEDKKQLGYLVHAFLIGWFLMPLLLGFGITGKEKSELKAGKND